jgi:tetratricopeptide (TPR) repeat protein
MNAIASMFAGLDAQSRGDFAAAEREFAAAIALPRAAGLAGLAALKDGRPQDACSWFVTAIARQPGDATLRVNYANALLALGDAAGARSALRCRPGRTGRRERTAGAEARATLAAACAKCAEAARNSGDPATALAFYEEALEAAPKDATLLLNHANALVDLDRLDAGETGIRAAIALDPGLKEAWGSLGFVLASRHRFPEAIAAHRAALAIDPDFAEVHWNLATAWLRLGDYPRGFAEHEWRKRHPAWKHTFPARSRPDWQGESLAGRTLLVHAEQGFGDAIMFARFLPVLAVHAARVILRCAAPLVGLLHGLGGAAAIALDAPEPAHDCGVDQMSIPLLLGTTPETIPGAAGYLPRPAGTNRARLRPRIGLAWAGNPQHSNDRRRSLPPGALTALLALPGIEFVSLQCGPRAHEYPLAAPSLPDFVATATKIQDCDAVVSIDSAVAHLAGAMGVPTHVLLPYAPDWRWLEGRTDTPWYASMRLYQQAAPGDWSAPLAGLLEGFFLGRKNQRTFGG